MIAHGVSSFDDVVGLFAVLAVATREIALKKFITELFRDDLASSEGTLLFCSVQRGCDMIDDFLKELERPAVNQAIEGKSFPKIAEIPLLNKPARRRIEVRVYAADKKWWRQSGVAVGKSEPTE
jgi:hypothetical protein